MSNHVPHIEQSLTAIGMPVIVCTTKHHARLRAAQGDPPYPMVSITDWDSYAELAELAKRLRGHVTSVATRCEGAIAAAGFMRDLLGLPGQSLTEALGYVDKAVMKRRLHRADVPAARHCVVSSTDEIPYAAKHVGGWPVIVKPRRGFAGINTHLIRSEPQLSDLAIDGVFDTAVPASPWYKGDPALLPLTKQPSFLVEELVDIDREYHCEGLWLNGQPIYQIPGMYHTPLHAVDGMLGSVLLPADHPDRNPIVHLAVRATKALGIGTGFTHTQIYRTHDGRWLLGDIAARPGPGGIQPAISHAFGIDVTKLQALVACGSTFHVRLDARPGVVGWAGPVVPPGRITQVATRDEILSGHGIIDATVAAKAGQLGGPTGSGLWRGLAGYAFLRADTVTEILALMPETANRYRVRVNRVR